METGHGKEVHEPRLRKAVSLRIRNPAPIAQKQGPNHRPPSIAGYIPANLTMNVRPHRDEDPLHSSPIASGDSGVIGIPHVQGTADSPSREIGPVVETARVSESRGGLQGPTEADPISLVDIGENARLLRPRGRLQRDTGPPVHGDCAA